MWPYYYMVILRRLEGLVALSAIDETGLRMCFMEVDDGFAEVQKYTGDW